MSEHKEQELNAEVSGEYNTLRAYLCMLKLKVASAREVQKFLDLSSPSLALHHLEKLRKYELVSKDDTGDYHVIAKSFGILRLYFRAGKWILPRTMFFVAIFSILTVGFLLSISQHRYFVIASIFSIIGLVYSIYETVRFYKALPRG